MPRLSFTLRDFFWLTLLVGMGVLISGDSHPAVLAQEPPAEDEIPAKLEAAAQKAFKAKQTFFIWSDKPAGPAKDFRLRYAVNPEVKSAGGFKLDDIATRIRLNYTAPNKMRVPYTGAMNGRIGYPFEREKFRGRSAVLMDIVKSDPTGDPAKATPLSNEVTVQLTFD